MNNKIYNRVLKEIECILEKNMTIRKVATLMNISKSTVHKDLHERLYNYNRELYMKVEEVMMEHIKVRHINGGLATKIKYEKIRKG